MSTFKRKVTQILFILLLTTLSCEFMGFEAENGGILILTEDPPPKRRMIELFPA